MLCFTVWMKTGEQRALKNAYGYYERYKHIQFLFVEVRTEYQWVFVNRERQIIAIIPQDDVLRITKCDFGKETQ